MWYRLILMLLFVWVGGGPMEAAPDGPRAAGAAAPANGAGLEADAPLAGEAQRLLDDVRADMALDAGARQAVTQLVAQAAGELDRAAALNAKTDEFDSATQAAPAMLATIREELAVAPGTPEPEVPAGADLAQLEQLLSQSEAELQSARLKAEELDNEVKGRADRRGALPTLIAEARDRLKERQEQLSHLRVADTEPAALARARRLELAARVESATAEVRAGEKELLSYDARRELLAARRERAARRLAVAEQLARAWRAEVAARRRRDSEKTAEQAREAQLASARLHPDIRRIAAHNAALADLRTGPAGLTRLSESANRELVGVREQIESINARHAQIRQRIDAAGLTDAVALLLRREKRDLPDVRQYGPRLRARKERITDVQLRLIDLDSQRTALFDVASRVEQLAAGLIDDSCPRSVVVPALTELLTTQRGLLDALLTEYNNYFNTLIDQDAAERQLVADTRSLADLIAEHILWVRSDAAVEVASIGRVARGLGELVSQPWGATVRAWWRDVMTQPLFLLLAVVLEVLIRGVRRRSGRRLKAMAAMTVRVRTDGFALTLAAAWYALLRSGTGVAACGYLGWRLGRMDGAPDVAAGMGAGFTALAVGLLVSAYVRELCAGYGLGEAHFHWNRAVLVRVRAALRRTVPVALALLWAGCLCLWFEENAGLQEVGRLCWVGFLVTVSAFVNRAFHVRREPLSAGTGPAAAPSGQRWRRALFVSCLVLPLALALAALGGYYYTAVQLMQWLAQSVLLVAGMLLVQALLLRWIQIIIRREDFQRRTREHAEPARPGAAAEVAEADADDDAVDVAVVSEHTRKMIRAGVGFVMLFGLWLIWADVLPALRLLDSVVLWTGAAQAAGAGEGGAGMVVSAITLADLLLALVMVAMTVVCARYVPGVLELVVLRQLSLGFGERYALSTLIRYVITGIGIVVVFNIMGIGWFRVQWLVAALSVGLGFGLQEIFANFVSGLILLFERPIRVGDYVTVGGTSGEVTRIQIRATTITDWDRKELVIPNRQFVTGELINWTLSDSILRVLVPVGIAYGSDTSKAKDVLLQVAAAHPGVLKEPPPAAVFVAFGDSTLNFELRVFIASAVRFAAVRDELHMAVDAAFRTAGIEIAFPQRDIHVRSWPAALAGGAAPPVEGSKA